MPLTLEQYATWLDTRDLPWPAPPEVEKPKARPALKKLPDVQVVLWNVYGSLLAIPGGELYFVHPQDMIMGIVLDKTIQEFNMWASMSRKPGQPADYLKLLYTQELDMQKGISTGGEKHPEVCVERIWEAIFKKLFQKDYSFDAGFYGALNELSEKVSYFFHASLQGTGCMEGAAKAMRKLEQKNIKQGLLGDGQCFTTVQLQRGLQAQDEDLELEALIPESRQFLSHRIRARKPSETLFRQVLESLEEEGIQANQILHVGSQIERDLVVAKRLGMKTALFAGDKASLEATPEQLKDPKKRPDVMLTELTQVSHLLG